MSSTSIQVVTDEEGDTTITFPEGGFPGSFWATVLPGGDRPAFSVGISTTDEGIVIDVHSPQGEMSAPIASTYAFDQDVIDLLAPEGAR